MAQARSTVLADNDSVRVTSWAFRPGDSTGTHRHELDYVVVPVTGGSFLVTATDGRADDMVQRAGEGYFRKAGATHDVANTTEMAALFVEIELK